MLHALLNSKHRKSVNLPITGTSSQFMNPSHSTQDLWLEAVFLWNNALLIFFFSRVHNERKVSSKTKGQDLACYQYLEASCLYFVMRVHFSVLRVTRFSRQKLPVRHIVRELGRVL